MPRIGSHREPTKDDVPDPGLQRRRVVRTGAAAAGLVALTSAIVLAVVQPSSSPVTCGQGAARLADVWGAGPAERVRHALVATGVPHAPATAQRVTAAFDEYAAAWTDMHRAACEATHVRGEQSEALLDLRMACLERRRGELGALVSLLINDSDAALVDRAAVAARSLPSIADCADTDRLKETIPLPGEPAVRRRIEEAEARLDEVKALHRTGRYAEGEKAVVALMGPAVATDHPPLVADAFYMRAVLARENADTGAALAAFRQSILAAARARDHRRVAQGWVDLLYTLADKAARLEEAAHLEPAVEAAVRQAGSPPELEGLWLRALGTLRKEQGRFDEAVALLERAIAAEERSDAPSAMRLGGYHTSLGISLARTGRYAEASEHMSKSRQHLEEVLGAEHPRLLAAGHHLGGLYLQQSRYREARDLLEEVRDGRVRALGPDHPDLAKTLNNLALAYKELGEYERAAETHREALRIKSARLGPEHPSVATSWNNLGLIAKRLGRNAEAREALERALAIREQQLGKDHVMVGSTLRNLGQLDLVEARYNDARRRLERALAIQRKALGERHADVGHVLANLGELDHRTGRPGGGRRYFERAVAIFDESVGADSAPAAIVRGQLARALLSQGRPLEAVTLAEAAVKAYESTPADPAELAGLRFILARCLRAAGRGGESARALALQAREGADPESELARDIDAWLADLSAR